MADHASPAPVTARRSRRVVAAALPGLIAIASASVAPAQLKWRTDFEAARKEAREHGDLLFVLVHQYGEAGNDGMLEAAYRHPRFVNAMRGVVPVIACYAADGDAERAAAEFGVTAAGMRASEKAVRKLLFGDDTVITPQHVILHPKGGVAWHNVRVCGLRQLVAGIQAAKRQLSMPAAVRANKLLAEASAMAGKATADGDTYARLSTLVRNSPQENFWPIMRVLDGRANLCQRLLRDATHGFDARVSRRRLQPGLDSPMRPFVGRMLEEIAAAEAADAPRPSGELVSMGRAAELEHVTFLDGVARHIHDGKDKVTVLWFFMPGDPELQQQLDAIQPVVQEFQAKGVRVIGLANTTDPQTDAPAIAGRGLPFPVATYRYSQYQPLFDVAMFPAAVVIDRSGDIVYKTKEDLDAMLHSYIDFAAIVRRLLESPRGSRASESESRLEIAASQ